MTPRTILDTCVVSYILKDDTRATGYLQQLTGVELLLSFQTLGELYCWPIARKWGEARTEEFLAEIRKYPVLPYNERVCWHWATLIKFPGRPMPKSDAWIAATALAFGIPLATHNKNDFAHIAGLDIIHVDGAA